MWLLLLLITPYLGVNSAHTMAHRGENDNCFDQDEEYYVKCTTAYKHKPSVCDCESLNACAIKFEITKVPDHSDTGVDPNDVFRVNNGLVGPTIIAQKNALVTVDVFNNIIDAPNDSDTSIHWHGMHQMNIPWMDGVGYVTQWPIPAGGKFRYMFRAKPSGTHWYHSHMRNQRDKGLYGALIVREPTDTRTNHISEFSTLSPFEDNPGETTLSIREHMKEGNNKNFSCFPDGSKLPELDEIIDSFQINGHKLSYKVDENNLEPLFDVKPGANYRFRLVAAMSETVLRFSIDHHKLHVIATDGFLTHPFETDILIIHVGERYDFILKAEGEIAPNTVYPIRIESVAVRCENFSKPERVGIGYLRYTSGRKSAERTVVKKHESRCGNERCTALNCPFQSYPIGASDVAIDCHDVYDALRLLHPTAEKDLPAPTATAFERFFNFDVETADIFRATVNGIAFILPKVPFVNSDNPTKILDECPYKNTHKCKARQSCPHTVYIRKENRMKPIRFILSSIPANKSKSINSMRTHPIHMHGHSFFVSKIAYPTYGPKGQVERVNEAVENQACGPGAWRYNTPPVGMMVNQETIRKDVIIVPAGGYVVVEFLANNPGWWFLHCHIDHHLSSGMGIVIAELPECQNPAPQKQQTSSFCYDAERFFQNEMNDICAQNEHEKGTDSDDRDGHDQEKEGVVYADEKEKAAKIFEKWLDLPV